jgi:hypothetical protein
MAIADKPTELSEQVLESLRDGERAALAAVRVFADTLDQVVPFQGEAASSRQKVIDAALEMADELVQTQYTFLHNVVRSAGQMLGATSTTSDTPPTAEAATAAETPPVGDTPPAEE